MALPSPLPSCARSSPFKSRVESGTPGTGVLVPASIRGEFACSRKSSVTLAPDRPPQFARLLKAAEADARAGVKVRTLVLVLTAMMGRATPSVLYSRAWLVRWRDAIG